MRTRPFLLREAATILQWMFACALIATLIWALDGGWARRLLRSGYDPSIATIESLDPANHNSGCFTYTFRGDPLEGCAWGIAGSGRAPGDTLTIYVARDDHSVFATSDPRRALKHLSFGAPLAGLVFGSLLTAVYVALNQGRIANRMAQVSGSPSN